MRHIRSHTLLNPQEAKLFIKYLDSVDHVISSRLVNGFIPHEEHLNSLFCEMMDENYTSLHCLNYTLKQLHHDLEEIGSFIKSRVTIETIKYPAHVENKVTSSDFGVTLEYKNFFEPHLSFSKALLIQAKRLFPKGEEFTLRSEYNSFNEEQLLKLYSLNKDLGEELAFYLFYNPLPQSFNSDTEQNIRYYYSKVTNSDIYDYAYGNHLLEATKSLKDHFNLGMFISSIDELSRERIVTENNVVRIKQGSNKPNAKNIYSSIFNGSYPFSWFLIYEFIMGEVGSSNKHCINIVQGKDFDAPVLPRYTIKISLSVGDGVNTYQD